MSTTEVRADAMQLDRPRLTLATVASVLAYLGILVGIGHGVAPNVLILFARGDLAVAAVVGIGLLAFGRGEVPAPRSRIAVALGLLALAYAVIRLLVLSEFPGVTALSAVPFAASAVWLLVEVGRAQGTNG